MQLHWVPRQTEALGNSRGRVRGTSASVATPRQCCSSAVTGASPCHKRLSVGPVYGAEQHMEALSFLPYFLGNLKLL